MIERIEGRATGDAGAVANHQPSPPAIEPGPGIDTDIIPQREWPMQKGMGGDGAAIPNHHGAAGLAENGGLRRDETAFAEPYRLLGQQAGLHLCLPGLGPGAMTDL